MRPKQNLLRDFGQLFILAFDGLHFTDELVDFFKTFRIGGLILFADNFENPEQLRALTDEIQDRCKTDAGPLLITTDHEGGKTQQFRTGFTAIPPLAILGKEDPQSTQAMHRKVARELRAAGINLNFAPVADLCAADASGSIGDRSFGEDTSRVTAHVLAAIAGLQEEGVQACAKHFPGHGATLKSSHQELPVITLSFEQLLQRDLVPFREAIAAGVSTVMTAHIVYPNAGDAKWPASLSAYWLTKILREEMGFEGVIITDSLEMKAMTNHWKPLESGKLALDAGADILLYYREKTQYQTFYELRLAFERGELDATKISNSLERIRVLKEKIGR